MATLAISAEAETAVARALSSSTAFSAAALMPLFSSTGFAPAATLRRPSATSAWASRVAVVVPSLGDVVGLDGDGLDQLRAEVLKRVLEVNLAGDGHAVVGHCRAAEGLGQDHVAAARAEGDLHSVGENVHAALDALTGLLIKCNKFCHGWL